MNCNIFTSSPPPLKWSHIQVKHIFKKYIGKFGLVSETFPKGVEDT